MTTWDDLVKPHLLAELREVDGLGASTVQLARQTPWPWADLRAPGTLEDGCYTSYVVRHLEELERAGLVRRVAQQGVRGQTWHLVTGDTGRVRGERTRR